MPELSYSKSFKVRGNLDPVKEGSLPSVQEAFDDVPQPCPGELMIALDAVREIVNEKGPSCGSVTYHENGQLVVLIYPGNANALG